MFARCLLDRVNGLLSRACVCPSVDMSLRSDCNVDFDHNSLPKLNY